VGERHQIEGTRTAARDHAGVAEQMVDNDQIPEGDRNFLRKKVLGEANVRSSADVSRTPHEMSLPERVDQLLVQLIKGLPRAMHPLKHRRKDLPALQFDNEYDVQSLFHALLRTWIRDIRVEEYTPSYAGKSTRVDFLLPKYKIILELKYVRDVQHSKGIGTELTIDVAHYRAHPQCEHLWAVVYDPHALIQNPAGISEALDGPHQDKNRSIEVKTFFLSAAPDV
jgi:hypothetical protein